MPRLTLLDLTQDILSDMSSDEVNSIDDTVESLQVAGIIKSTYFNIIDGRDWPHLYQMFVLEASGDSNKPTHMRLPDNIIEIEWLKYNTRSVADVTVVDYASLAAFPVTGVSGNYYKALDTGYTYTWTTEYVRTNISAFKDAFKEIAYKSPKEFMNILDARDSKADYVTVVEDDTTIDLNIYNDRQPQYFTSFDNENIILDAYLNTLESTLQASKTQAYGKVYPTWIQEDSFIPDLPTQSFSYLLNEAKSTCFLRLAQAGDQKAEQHSVTQRRRMSQDAWRVADTVKYAAYGRRGKKNG